VVPFPRVDSIEKDPPVTSVAFYISVFRLDGFWITVFSIRSKQEDHLYPAISGFRLLSLLRRQ
jgi:hypothetical protein